MKDSKSSKYRPVEYLPLTGSQKWLINEMPKIKHPGWTTVEFLVKTKMSMDEVAMETAINYLLEKYENLRVKFINNGGNWLQELYPLSDADPFEMYDLSGNDSIWQAEKVKHVCMKTRYWLLPQRGNLIKIIFFKFSENEGRLWFCMHHVISDFVSTILLSTEFITIYNNIIQGKELKRQVSKDYRQWLYIVEGYSRDVLLPSELEYWVSLPWDKANVLPSDYPMKFYNEDIIVDAINNKTLIDSYRIDIHLMEQEDTLKLLNKHGIELENLLIAVFFLAVANHMKADWLDINVSYSGRKILPSDYNINTNRLLGFLAAVRAVLLKNPGTGNTTSDINNVIEQIKSIPNAGIGFNLIMNHIKDNQLRESFSKFRKQPEILFNFLGRMDSKVSNEQYEIIEEDTGYDLFNKEIKNTLLECAMGIKQNQLFLQTSYSQEYFKTKTIDRIMHSIIAMLKEIIIEPKVQKNGVNVLLET